MEKSPESKRMFDEMLKRNDAQIVLKFLCLWECSKNYCFSPHLFPSCLACSSRNTKQLISATNLAELWSVQCGECFKWRLIPTEEEFEEIRSKFVEDPFVCSRKPNVSCEDPTDIERDESRIWAIHKPGIPKTPPGFKKDMVLRKDQSKMDCYYSTPNGKRLRASTDVPKFLDSFPEYKKDLSCNDFNFTSPKIM